MSKPMGRPIKMLDEEQAAKFLYWVKEDLLLTNAARHTGVSIQRIDRLRKRGEEDREEDVFSEYRDFLQAIEKNQALKISEMLKKIEGCPKNWAAIAWKLEKCFVEDFGKEAELYKLLLEDYRKLLQDMINLKNQPTSVQALMKSTEPVESEVEKE